MSQISYIESGAEWIGRLPGHWKIKPMFSVVEQLDEKNTGSRVQNLLSLSYGKIVRRDYNSNFGLLPESFDTYQIVQPGDIVLRLLDLQNDHVSLRVGLVKEEGIVTSAYVSVRPTKGLNSQYAAYLLHAYDLKKVFYSFGGGCRQSMGFEDLKRLPIPFPPPAEQCSIASYIDEQTAKIDRLIEMRRRQMELLQDQRSALIQQTVTRGLNPDAPMKDSGLPWLGEIPAHWQTTRLAHHTTRIGDGLHGTPEYVDESPYHFVNGNNLSGGAVTITPTTGCVSEGEFEKHSVALGSSTLLMSINGTIGNVAYYENESIILGKSAAYINCAKGLLRRYLFYFLQSSSAGSFFQLEATGTTIFNLSLASIRNLPIALPSLDEQKQIADFIEIQSTKFDAISNSYARQLSLLTEYRAALIHECVTGQREVKLT